MAEKFSGVRVVTELSIEMRSRIITLAGDRQWSDTRESWLARAARRAGISYRAAKALFYCEAADPRAFVVERVRRASEDIEASNARREYAELIGRIARLETAMGVSDPEYFGPEIDALRSMARDPDSAVDS